MDERRISFNMIMVHVCECEYECMFITAAPRCEFAYVSVRNKAERSSSRTSHKYMYTSKRSLKGCNVVRLKVEEEGDKGSRP